MEDDRDDLIWSSHRLGSSKSAVKQAAQLGSGVRKEMSSVGSQAQE